MKIKSQTTILISVCIVVAGIIFSSLLGLWNTKATKIPDKLTQNEYEQQYDPADIRGSYTFQEISSLYNIPMEDLAAAFLVEASDAPEFQCKNLETIFVDSTNEIGTGSVRMFVAFYLGLPYDSNGDTYVTDAAAEILKKQSAITSQQLDYLEKHTVSIRKPK